MCALVSYQDLVILKRNKVTYLFKGSTKQTYNGFYCFYIYLHIYKYKNIYISSEFSKKNKQNDIEAIILAKN